MKASLSQSPPEGRTTAGHTWGQKEGAPGTGPAEERDRGGVGRSVSDEHTGTACALEP